LWGHLLDWLTASQLSHIQTLDLRFNLFSGKIPSVANLTSFTGLYLKGNSFIGSIPDIFYNCSNFRDFYMSDNYLSGIFPPSLLEANSLWYFIIDDNNFNVRIDEVDWSLLTALTMMSMTRNYLYGSFPFTLCNTRSLLILNFGFNYLSHSVKLAFTELLASSHFKEIRLVDLYMKYLILRYTTIYKVLR
jgi:hypothetical protein